MTTNPDRDEKRSRRAVGFAGMTGKVLLTGASGFLGMHLLRELLVEHGATVTCVLRGASTQRVQRSIEEKWHWFFPEMPFEPYRQQLHILVADVTAGRLGLDERAYDALAETHGAVFNVAANVNGGGSLEEVLPVNVGLVDSLIDLCRYGGPKHLHHVSTVSVTGYFTSKPRIDSFAERHLEEGQTFADAYGESKYRAEKILRQAMAEGIAATAYRVGYIGPHHQTGKFQQNPDQNYTSRYLQACIRLGFAPYLPNTQVPLTPVDTVARAILALASRRDSVAQTYYVETPHPLTHYDIMRVLQAAGYPLRLMGMDDLIACGPTLSSDEAALGLVLPQGTEPYPVPIDTRFSRESLAACGFEYEAASSEWLGRFVRHAIDVGFLPKPRFWEAAPLPPGLF
jgi:thioester reductase-like protein